MSNRFEITISAADKATATIRKINNNMSQMGRPMMEFGKKWKAAGREVIKNPIPQAIGKIGTSAMGAAKWVGRMLSPMSALGGIGTIAGITALAESWGRAGINITNASARVGLSVGSLQSFRGAAAAAGLSADGMQASLVGLGDILQDALYGRNQSALIMLNKLNVSIKRNKDGTIDVTQATYDLADAFDKIKNPQVKAMAARTFGMEGMLPMMKGGSKGMREYEEQARRVGAADDEAAAANDRLGKSFGRLGLAWDGFENRMAKGTIGKMMLSTSESLSRIVSGGRYQAKDSNAGPLTLIPALTAWNFASSLFSSKPNRWDAANAQWKPGMDGRAPAGAKAIGIGQNSTMASVDRVAAGIHLIGNIAETAFGKLIARGEGNYGSVNLGARGGYAAGTADLEKMTVRQVQDAQKSGQFNAAGRYQIIGNTLGDAAKTMGLSGNELFDRGMQDRIFSEYLVRQKRPEIGRYLSGDSNDATAALRASSAEWASVESPGTGKSLYEGTGNNKATISAAEMLAALESTRQSLATVTDALGKNGTIKVEVNAPHGTTVTASHHDVNADVRVNQAMNGL